MRGVESKGKAGAVPRHKASPPQTKELYEMGTPEGLLLHFELG